MNIALFHEVLPGGARRGANEFAKALRQKGHLVDLFLVDKTQNENEKSYYDHVFFYSFIPKVWTGKDWRAKLYKDTIELFRLYRLHKRIAQEINNQKYDFAFIHPSQFTQAPFVLRFVKNPKLYYCQEPLRMLYEPLFEIPKNLDTIRNIYEMLTRFIKKTIDKHNVSCASVILANSTFTQENIYAAYKRKSTVVHMGVDKNRFKKLSLKKDIDVLFIGSKDPVDGYELFKQAISFMKKKPVIKYLLRGSGEWVSDDKKLNEYYCRAKIVICFGYKEPFGLTPLETMAAGSIPFCLNEGGYKDSVRNRETGLLVSRNPNKIAEAMEWILSLPKEQQRIQDNLKKEIENNWTWEKSAKTLVSIYEKWKKNNS